MSQTFSELFSSIDFDMEKRSAVQTYEDYILAERQLVPCVAFYSFTNRIAWIRGHSYESAEEHTMQLMQMLMCSSSIKAVNTMLTFAYPVVYSDNSVRDSIVTIIANHLGSVAEPFSYTLEDDKVIFNDSLEIPEDILCYPSEINEILATSMKINRTLDKPSKLLQWLSDQNFEIEFSDTYNIDNIDIATFIP
jgi:hypothetical protein